ncbi:hypothetical protein [Methanosarcina sp. 1.H.T.1A.1]|nr:hypothetical protein [Methanosarcina sp. 1.H.T.1A.1]
MSKDNRLLFEMILRNKKSKTAPGIISTLMGFLTADKKRNNQK